MELNKQVCSVEQSIKLKELGINCTAQFFWYTGDTGNNVDRVLPTLNNSLHDDGLSFFAYTVAELGVMLPHDGHGIGEYYTLKDVGYLVVDESLGGNNSGFSVVPAYPDSDNVDTWPEVCNGVFYTEAEARASLLIYLLENNHTTPEEVNQRLNSN